MISFTNLTSLDLNLKYKINKIRKVIIHKKGQLNRCRIDDRSMQDFKIDYKFIKICIKSEVYNIFMYFVKKFLKNRKP